jgi:hypothetical protein
MQRFLRAFAYLFFALAGVGVKRSTYMVLVLTQG